MEFLLKETGTKFTAELTHVEWGDITDDTLNEVFRLRVHDGDTIPVALASYIVHILGECTNPNADRYDGCPCEADNYKLTVTGFDHFKWGFAWCKAFGGAL